MLLTKIKLRRITSATLLGLLVALAPAAIATACTVNAQSCSTDWQVSEAFFGSGGQFSCNPGDTLCARQAAGEQTVGQSCDPGDQQCIQAGFNTDRTPFIEFIVNTSSVDVGVLEESQTHVGSATFSIKTYLAQGYQITTESVAPSTSGHTFATPGTPTAPTPGTELFGMNLVANTCPGSAPSSGAGSCTSTLGANPVCNPSGFCNYPANVTIGANYDTADEYYYPASGSDTLISSTSSTGQTDFTLSYIFNISNVTPAGLYRMEHDLVATSTF